MSDICLMGVWYMSNGCLMSIWCMSNVCVIYLSSVSLCLLAAWWTRKWTMGTVKSIQKTRLYCETIIKFLKQIFLYKLFFQQSYIITTMINMLFYENNMCICVYASKRMRYDALGYGMSWVQVVLLPMLPLSWNALRSPTTFIHNFF